MSFIKIGSFLKRQKDSIEIQNSGEYKRITIKTKHQGIILRDLSKGSSIGTKLQFKVKTGQFLLSKIDARLGAFGIVPDELDSGIITGNFWTFDVDTNKVNSEWFNLFTSSGNFYEICDKASSGTTHRKYLDEKAFLNFEIWLPSLKEQNDFLGKYREYKKYFDILFKELNQQQAYLQLLRQSIVQEAIQGKLLNRDKSDEPAEVLLKRIKAEKQKLIKEGKLKKEKDLSPITEGEIPFQLPKDWVWCRLGEIIDLKSGVTLGKTYKEELIEVPYLRVANVQRGSIDITHVKTLKVPQYEIDKYRLKKGDLCMIEGGDWDKVGRCSIWIHDIDPCIHQNHIFRLRFYGNISNEWSEMYLNSSIARRYFESFSKQTTNLASINKTQLTSLLFPLPPFSDQHRVVERVRQLQQKLKALESQVQQSRLYAQQLMQVTLQEAFEMNKKNYLAPMIS